MKKNFFLSPTGGESAGKVDQADVLAKLSGMENLLAPLKLTLPDLIAQHASLTTDKSALTSDVAKLKGDSTKLVAGASLPTDLVSAANTISEQAAEIASLKASAKTVDEAAAAKVAALGIKNEAAPAPATGAKKLTLDEEASAFLKANPNYQASPFSPKVEVKPTVTK